MSKYIIPVILIAIIAYGKFKKIDLYSSFCEGAKKSFKLIFDIFPYIVAILICISLFRESGLLNIFVNFISPIFNIFGIPNELCELIILRPFSGGGSLSILENIISNYGADSYIARCACCIFGSSETIFYVSSIYFVGTKTKKITPAIVISLIASVIGSIFCCLFCKIM